MIRHEFYEKDGQCFARMVGGCSLGRVDGHCGTYRCPFYKPKDCKDWIRMDTKYAVFLYAPEEVKYVHVQNV